jgi:hypothetical protein
MIQKSHIDVRSLRLSLYTNLAGLHYGTLDPIETVTIDCIPFVGRRDEAEGFREDPTRHFAISRVIPSVTPLVGMRQIVRLELADMMAKVDAEVARPLIEEWADVVMKGRE